MKHFLPSSVRLLHPIPGQTLRWREPQKRLIDSLSDETQISASTDSVQERTEEGHLNRHCLNGTLFSWIYRGTACWPKSIRHFAIRREKSNIHIENHKRLLWAYHPIIISGSSESKLFQINGRPVVCRQHTRQLKIIINPEFSII